MLGTLQWGVQASDLDVAQPSLEALAALARFHATALAAGAQGVGPLPGSFPTRYAFLILNKDL